MWKDVSPRTSPCEALKAHLPDRFMDRLKKSVSKTMTSFSYKSWNKVLAETHEALVLHFTSFAFPLSSKCNRSKGCASGPMDVTSSSGFAVHSRRGLCRSSVFQGPEWKAPSTFWVWNIFCEGKIIFCPGSCGFFSRAKYFFWGSRWLRFEKNGQWLIRLIGP